LQLAVLADGDRVRDMAATILSAAEDTARLVGNLLAYARHQPDSDAAQVDLGEIVSQAVALVRATLPPAVRLRTEMAEAAFPLRGSASKLLTVALNLLTNATDAMEGRAGNIALALTEVEGSKIGIASLPPLIHPRYFRLTISDEGVGMDQDTLARACDPFFTSKAVGKGTGLGLSIAHGIVLDHQGAIAISSTPGHGTNIAVFLPASQ